MKYVLTPTFETDHNIPVLTIQADTPDADKQPRILVLHGLEGAKEHWLGFMYKAAKAGFTAVAPDLRLHGEWPDAPSRAEMLNVNFAEAMRQIIYESAKEISHLLDVWEPQGHSWGMVGVSAGGFVSHVLALSEKRIKAMSLCGSSPDWMTIDPDKVPHPFSPGGLALAAMSPVNHADQYAPLALQMLNGDADFVVRADGAIKLANKLRPLYDKKGIGDRLDFRLYKNYPHEFRDDMQLEAIAWMKKWLPIG